MEILELKAEARTSTGKQSSRKLRGLGSLPAIVYGKGSDPVRLTINAKDFFNITNLGGSNIIIKLNMDGEKNPPTVILKEVQRNPVKDNVLHVDFQRIALDQKIQTTVSLNIVGESVGVKEGGVMNVGQRELLIEALPTEIPSGIDADVSEIAIGDSLKVSDLPISDKYTILTGADETLITVVPPQAIVEEVVEEELEEVAEGEEVPEGEEGAAAEEAGGEEGE